MSRKRKILVILLTVALIIATLLQSWNVDNLGSNKWFDNGIDILLAITVLIAVATTPEKTN